MDVILFFIIRIKYFKSCKIEKQKGCTIGGKKIKRERERERKHPLFLGLAFGKCMVP